MKRTHAALAVAAAAFLSAPVFAQSCDLSSSNLQMSCPSTSTLGAGAVTSSSGSTVSSGTGVTVTPGAPNTSVTVVPSTSAALGTVPGNRMLPGAASVQASQTTVLGGPANGASGSQTTVTQYWVNVPANVERRGDFQRWLRLKP